MLRIYDGNNYARVVMETDLPGLAPRTIMQDTFSCPDPVLWIWDAKDGSRKRRDIYPGYKMGRTPPPQGIWDGFEMIQNVLKHTKAMQVTVPGYEADDVIATLARRQAKAGNMVAVYSADYDFWQLKADYPKHIIVGCKPKKCVTDPKFTRLYKVCVGDPSDKIPGIPGFGDKAWSTNGHDRLLERVTKWVTTLKVEDQDFTGLHITPRCREWIETKTALLQTYWMIVGFFDVDVDLINQHLTIGQPDMAKADAVLREFLQ